jgi:hypothetical protein
MVGSSNPDNFNRSMSVPKKVVNKTSMFFTHTVTKFFESVFGLIFSVFLIPMMAYYSYQMKSKFSQKKMLGEEIPDLFVTFYGLSKEHASLNSKLGAKEKYRHDKGIYGRIPLLDISASYNALTINKESIMCGYPPSKQRILNTYLALDFELKNDKDLPENLKQEIRDQMEEVRKIYDDFVKEESPKGIFYKIFSGFARKNIEKAAKKDRNLLENLLIPLKEKSDSGAFKE